MVSTNVDSPWSMKMEVFRILMSSGLSLLDIVICCMLLPATWNISAQPVICYPLTVSPSWDTVGWHQPRRQRSPFQGCSHSLAGAWTLTALCNGPHEHRKISWGFRPEKFRQKPPHSWAEGGQSAGCRPLCPKFWPLIDGQTEFCHRKKSLPVGSTEFGRRGRRNFWGIEYE